MLLDIGLSLIYLIVLINYSPIELTPSLVFLTILFGLLPDIDAPIEIFQRGTLGGKLEGFHRKFTHYPIIYVPIAYVLYFTLGKFMALLFSINILSHFIHDSLLTGCGIKWFWPLSNDNFMLLTGKLQGEEKTKLYSRWKSVELAARIQKYGDEFWFRNFYTKLSPVLIIESLGFIIGLTVLIIYVSS